MNDKKVTFLADVLTCPMREISDLNQIADWNPEVWKALNSLLETVVSTRTKYPPSTLFVAWTNLPDREQEILRKFYSPTQLAYLGLALAVSIHHARKQFPF